MNTRALHPTGSAAASRLLGIVFSKDRALQLDAVLRSWFLHCGDPEQVNLQVYYTTSGTAHEAQYQTLKKAHPTVTFVRETYLRQDVLRLVAPFEHFLLMVDDNLFVADFAVAPALRGLAAQPQALGFSLHLGSNIRYCYPADAAQVKPVVFTSLTDGVRRFDWTANDLSFGYPLECSSTIYRTRDLLPQMGRLEWKTVNQLESVLAAQKQLFAAQPFQLCFERSVVFACPLNVINKDFPGNRAGRDPQYSVESLARKFDAGWRVDVAAYAGFTPRACHQELELTMHRPKQPGTP